MAKRYEKFEEITEGEFKPRGTMGTHHCTVVLQGNNQKVVIGSVTGRVTLKPGDTLGYDCGNVWIVPRPESYKDPIRRVLAQAHLSQKLLEYSVDPIEYIESWQDTTDWPTNSVADFWTGEEITVLGTYDRKNLESWDNGGRYQVTGGDAIVIEKVVGRETTEHRPRRMTRIIIRPAANKVDVANWLFANLVKSK